MPKLEHRLVVQLQVEVAALHARMQNAAAGWWYVRAKTVLKWSDEMQELHNKLNYIAAIITSESAKSGGGRHPCHDQYCYDPSNHTCHQEGCTQ